ncbi:MAG: hypothetical protein H6837_16325 [Planctomycetes bacterium]|nr:hypothetical protein [Planctomycetota bacterium]
MPTRHLLLGPALLLAAPLVAQKPAPFRLEAVSRNPTNAEESTTEAALGQRVGTRGLGRDILRLRFTGDLPEGLQLRGSACWGDLDETPLRHGEWCGTPERAAAARYLAGFRLRLEGRQAHLWRLRYRAHLAYRGDTTWHGAGAFLGCHGQHNFNTQAFEVELVARQPAARELVLELARVDVQDGKPHRLQFLAIDPDGKPLVHKWQGQQVAPGNPFCLAKGMEYLPWLATPSVPLGATRRLHVLVFEPGAKPADTSAIAELLQRLVGTKRSAEATELSRRPFLRPLRLIGGMTLMLSCSTKGRVSAMFGSLTKDGGRVRATPRAQTIGGAFATSLELRGSARLDLLLNLRER